MIAEGELIERNTVPDLRSENTVFKKDLRPQIIHLELEESFLPGDPEKHTSLVARRYILLLPLHIIDEIIQVGTGLQADLKARPPAGLKYMRLADLFLPYGRISIYSICKQVRRYY